MYCYCICADRELTAFTIQNVHLFERLGTGVDISTPIGAWHYATILCRLSARHAKRLQAKFSEVKLNGRIPAWTAAEQIAELDRAQTLPAQALQTSQARTQEAQSQQPAGMDRRRT